LIQWPTYLILFHCPLCRSRHGYREEGPRRSCRLREMLLFQCRRCPSLNATAPRQNSREKGHQTTDPSTPPLQQSEDNKYTHTITKSIIMAYPYDYVTYVNRQRGAASVSQLSPSVTVESRQCSRTTTIGLFPLRQHRSYHCCMLQTYSAMAILPSSLILTSRRYRINNHLLRCHHHQPLRLHLHHSRNHHVRFAAARYKDAVAHRG
jgi:hypothetical protein